MKISVTCQKCGLTFMRFKSHVDKGFKTSFCSNLCRSQYHGLPLAARGARAAKMRATAIDRFWQRVDKRGPGECWEWTALRQKRGYGIVSWHGKLMLAHRVALNLSDGDFDSPLHVCHSCDNPPCCNPAHLWRGTDLDNSHDAATKGRLVTQRGEASARAKLTIAAVKDIRSSTERGVDLARKYNVTKSLIGHIRKNRAWRHIP